MSSKWIGIAALAVIGAASIAYAFYSQHQRLESTRVRIEELRTENMALSDALREARHEAKTLSDALVSEQGKNAVFAEQIESISSTVGTLDKLARTDPELLAKYSKVYFLNENYAPSELEIMDPAYRYDASREIWLHSKVKPHLYALLKEAGKDGIDIRVLSGYRSFETQADLKDRYVYRYGSGANAFSADQGYSEHQLGTTFDFTTESVGSTFTGFERTDAYDWLVGNAHRFGFVLSYPEGSQYYQFEPWHWRFVSVGLAARLNRNDEYLYDLDQRVIDTYLVDFFE